MKLNTAQASMPDVSRPRPGLAKASRLALIGAAAVGLCLLASACGGSSSHDVAQVATTASSGSRPPSSSGSKANAMAYSACMRKHGVPNFPDPDSQGRIKITFGQGANGQTTGVDVNSPQFKNAQQVCRSLEPAGDRPNPQQQAKQQQQSLKFSACMRSHGVPQFPDPKFSPGGGSTMDMRGIDPNSPRFKAAQKTCQNLAPGAGVGSSSGTP